MLEDATEMDVVAPRGLSPRMSTNDRRRDALMFVSRKSEFDKRTYSATNEEGHR